MKKFLDIHTLARLNHEGTENPNGPIQNNMFELVMESHNQKNTQDQVPSLLNSTKY